MDVERHRLHSDADGDDSKQSLRGDVGGECSNDSGCQEDGPRADEVLACVVKFYDNPAASQGGACRKGRLAPSQGDYALSTRSPCFIAGRVSEVC